MQVSLITENSFLFGTELVEKTVRWQIYLFADRVLIILS